ncbi:MAG: transglycosylase SLT domain-containing protein [Flavobacteriales bacterium]
MKVPFIVFNFFVGIFTFAYAQTWETEQLEVVHKAEVMRIMRSDVLFEDGWTELPQAKFWKKVMQLSPDSSIVNVAKNRQELGCISTKIWQQKSQEAKKQFKDSVRVRYGLNGTEEIYVTPGKSDFYQFGKVFHQLGRGISQFEKLGVDPWYAQAILLIESPGQLKKSVSGAYGPFQLMPDVAKKWGLRVDGTRDERSDFDKSAYAAAKMMRAFYIPEARKILNAHGISYNETDLWFRLYVMHIYHAGPGNVAAVTQKIKPREGSMELIKQMWINTAAGFGNSSQNYSQLAIAAQWILHEYVYTSCEDVFECSSR